MTIELYSERLFENHDSAVLAGNEDLKILKDALPDIATKVSNTESQSEGDKFCPSAIISDLTLNEFEKIRVWLSNNEGTLNCFRMLPIDPPSRTPF